MGIYSSFRNGVGNTLVRIIYGNCFSKPTTISDDDDQDNTNISSPDHHVSQPPPPPPTNGVSSLGSDLLNFDNTFEVPELLSEHVPSSSDDDNDQDYSNISPPDHHVSQPAPTNGVLSLGSDLFNFDNTFEVKSLQHLNFIFVLFHFMVLTWNFLIFFKVPELLSEHVASSKKAQAKWYEKLLKAWKGAKPPPKTPEQASRLVMQTLQNNQKADVEGLLKFYGLPVLHEHQIDIAAVEVFPPPRLKGVEFELHTFPVDAYAVAVGDGLTVYVDVADPREATISVPEDVQVAVSERSKARASKDKRKAKALHKTIVDAGYRVVRGPNKKEILARKYQIRLRGIDAPENKQPFGKEAKKELTKLLKGNCVIVHVYGEDKYHRLVGDVYCNGQFAQEVMLKKGLAWHYAAFDKRPELKKWAKEAKAAGIGLWADSDPEEPWKWRKNNPTPYV
ncbi:hypothetical protein MKW92_032770 [Papaver armeniacum]|nr:hypothetical protein MKW92_032770 [Papaver armeniacum]